MIAANGDWLTPGLALRPALRAAVPFAISDEFVEQCLGDDALFRRAWMEGLDAIPLSDRRGHLCRDLGLIAESVATRVLAEAGLDLFSEAVAFDGHGVDLLALNRAGEVVAVEVKGTLRAGSFPRLGRSRLRQMSLKWLSSPTNPAMFDWRLEGCDVYGAIAFLDFGARVWRAALTRDFVSYAPVREVADLHEVGTRGRIDRDC